MTPALYIKPDGKVYLIENCPEEPKESDYLRHRAPGFNDFIAAEGRYQKQLKEAKDQSILVENQEIAWRMIFPDLIGKNYATDFKYRPQDHDVSYRINNGWFCRDVLDDKVYPMPGLKYRLDWRDDHGLPNTNYQIAILEEPVQEVKQEEQEESQEEILNEIIDYISSSEESYQKQEDWLKQHFKIQRR